MLSATQLSQLPDFPSVETLSKTYKRLFPDRSFDRYRPLQKDELSAILPRYMKNGQPLSDPVVRELSAQLESTGGQTGGQTADNNPADPQTTTRTKQATGGQANRQVQPQTRTWARTKQATDGQANTDKNRTDGGPQTDSLMVRIFGRRDQIGRLDIVNYAEMAFQAQNLTVLMGGFGVALSVMTIMITLELQHLVKDIKKDKASQYGQWIFGIVSAFIAWLIHYPAIKVYLHGHEDFLPVDVRVVSGIFSFIAWLLSLSAIVIVRMKLRDDDWYSAMNPETAR